MNVIDIIESRRLKEKISIEALCAKTKKVNPVSYSKYLSRETKPPFEGVVLLLEAVGLKLNAVDKYMRGDAIIAKWGSISMWIRCYNRETLHLFRQATGFESGPTIIISATLFYTWYYKFNKIAPEDAMFKDLLGQGMTSELYEWGLIASDHPSETALIFYNKVADAVTYYLDYSDVITEVYV